MKRSHRIRGVTLIEALMAALLTSAVLTTILSVFVVGMMSWSRGEGKILAETGSHAAIRAIANELRQAINVTVDSNGLGLSYVLPLQDSTGTDIIPISTDGVARRIQLDGTNLDMVANGSVRKLCSNVILTDPLSSNGSQAYKIFTAGAGQTTRSITVELVTKTSAYESESVTSRNRETMFLRNVPVLNY